MIAVEANYLYNVAPDEAQLAALAALREIYGVRRLEINAPSRRILIEYDASRLRSGVLRSLLRRTGLDLQEA